MDISDAYKVLEEFFSKEDQDNLNIPASVSQLSGVRKPRFRF